MVLFSQRKGLKPIKDVMQVDSMDDDLRNGLWNALTIFYWDQMENYSYLSSNKEMSILFKRLWHFYFKEPLDTLNEVLLQFSC